MSYQFQGKMILPSGRLITSENPLEINPNDFSVNENFRYTDRGVKTVEGMTKINSSPPSKYNLSSSIHYKKRTTNETHVLVQGVGVSDSAIYDITSSPPDEGEFSASAILDDIPSVDPGVFSILPEEQVGFSIQGKSYIWSGEKHRIGRAILTNEGNTKYYDYTEQLNSPSLDAVNITGDSGSSSYIVILLGDTSSPGYDSGPNSLSFTNNGASQDTDIKKYGASSIKIESGDYIISSSSTPYLNLSAKTWRISTWLRTASTSGEIFSVIYDTNNYFQCDLSYSKYITIKLVLSGSQEFSYQCQSHGGYNINDEEFHHIAVESNGATFSVFIDGILCGWVVNDNPIKNGDSKLKVGAASGGIVGHIDEFTIQEITTLTELPFIPVQVGYENKIYFDITTERQIQGVYFEISRANTELSTAEVYVYTANGYTLVNSTDGTSYEGVTLAKNGEISWDYSLVEAIPSMNHGVFGYNVRIVFYGLDEDTSTCPQVRRAYINAPMQPFVDLWDGVFRKPNIVYVYDGDTYSNVTEKVYENDYETTWVFNGTSMEEMPLAPTFLDIGGYTTSKGIILASTERICGIEFTMVPQFTNTNSERLIVEKWDGEAWVNCSTQDDTGGIDIGASLNRSGIISWVSGDELSEQCKSILSELPLYVYRVSFSGTLSSKVYINKIRYIPAPKNVDVYSFVGKWQNRVVLGDNYYGQRNEFIISSYGSACVFNGEDSATLYLGYGEKFIAAHPIFYTNANGNYEDLIIVSDAATYVLRGTSPEDFHLKRISEYYNCVSPNTMREIIIQNENGVGMVICWLSSSGLVMTDGSTVWRIDGDIKNSIDKIDYSYSPWFNADVDVVNSEYVLTYYTEDEDRVCHIYDFKRNKWRRCIRKTVENINGVVRVFGDYNENYLYGFSYTGYVYRMNYGTTFDGDDIISILRFPPHLITPLDNTYIRGIVSLVESANTRAIMEVAVYQDGADSAQTIHEIPVYSLEKRYSRQYIPVNFKGIMFEFEIVIISNDINGGIKPIGIFLSYSGVNKEL